MTKFMVGLGLGVTIGVLVAPASGEETRRQLREKAEDLRDEKLGNVIQKSRVKASEVARAAEQSVDKVAVRMAGEEPVRRSYGT
jgi:gas vesicle protein